MLTNNLNTNVLYLCNKNKSKMAKSTKVKNEKVKVSPIEPLKESDWDNEMKDSIELVEEFKVTPPEKVGIKEPIFSGDKSITNLRLTIPNEEEKTEEQKIVDYVANSHSEKIDLAPILKSLYPIPTYSQPPVYLQQGESKRIKGLLSRMVADGLISLVDDQYLKLGKFYYAENETKTKYRNIDTVRIFAKK